VLITALTGWIIVLFVGAVVVVVHSGWFPIPSLDGDAEDDGAADALSPVGNHTNRTGTSSSPWDISSKSIFALGYFVVVYSIGMYSTINWANKYVPPSSVVLYTVMQPVSASLLSLALIRSEFIDAYPDVTLELPGYNALGAIGVVAGILLLTFGEPAETQAGERKGGASVGAGADGDDSDDDDAPLLRGTVVAPEDAVGPLAAGARSDNPPAFHKHPQPTAGADRALINGRGVPCKGDVAASV